MCRKPACIICFVFVVGLVFAGAARGADPGLVAWYRFDGDASDSSGNNLHGTEMGNPTYDAGVFGQAISLDGDGDYVDCGLAPEFDITDFITFTYWIKVVAFDKSWNTVLSRGDDSWRSSRAGTNNFMEAAVSGTTGDWTYAVTPVDDGEWHHIGWVYDGTMNYLYVDGEVDVTEASTGQINVSTYPLWIGDNSQATGRFWNGLIDDVMIFNRALSHEEIQTIMQSSAGPSPTASSPNPADGAFHLDTWVNVSWRPGDFVVSHDVYLSDNFDDVNDGTGDASRGNQGEMFYVAGFPGFAYPDGLVPGTTYYWRIDEVNDAEPNSPWKGDIWSFSIPPKTAYGPAPADGADSVELNVQLGWTTGFGARLHTVYFGEDFDTVSNAAGGAPKAVTTFTPGPLKLAKTYYWRVDEFDTVVTHKGDVWSFTTEGAVGSPNPPDGAVDVKQTPTLTWSASAVAASHRVYLGTDAGAVANATEASPEFQGTTALGNESFDPGKLSWETTFFWRIEEVNDTNPDSPWIGSVWSFTTAGFLIVDDFEEYTDNDAAGEAIWQHWIDGFGVNTNGSQVGYILVPYAEQTIVHGGAQSMPLSYNNRAGVTNSEAELKLGSPPRDWTEEGVVELSIWFQGQPASVGSFAEGPAGTFTMTGSGADIWNDADEFHFAYKTLTGTGSIVARVDSVQNTNGWAKAGVMIRETLEPSSKHAFAAVTPDNGVGSQGRLDIDGTSFNTNETGIAAPHWVKLERDLAGNFTVSHSANGSAWAPVPGATAQNIQMDSTVFVGLALTSHNVAQTCEAVFSNVTITGNAGTQWTNQDIGIASNAAEPLYVAVSNSTGAPVVVAHDDPVATTIDTWTEWTIDLSKFSDQGINLSDVDMIAIGMGSKAGVVTSGGSGVVFVDDVRLLRPARQP